MAEIPAYPGAKKIETGAGPAAGNVAANIGGMNMGGVQVQSNSNTTRYSIPASTDFAHVKGFYSKELIATGMSEKASVALNQAGMGTTSASFSSSDGIRTVTVTVMNNPVNAAEKWLTVSESSTAMK
jgi:hypothetical protein